MNKIKIICTQEQYQNILEVWCAGCCWIGTGENNPHDARNTRRHARGPGDLLNPQAEDKAPAGRESRRASVHQESHGMAIT